MSPILRNVVSDHEVKTQVTRGSETRSQHLSIFFYESGSTRPYVPGSDWCEGGVFAMARHILMSRRLLLLQRKVLPLW